jgi:serine/threonine-protein kinase
MTSLTVPELLRRWEQARAGGQDLTATELCRDCPELLDEVSRTLDERRAREAVPATIAPLSQTLVEPPAGRALGETLPPTQTSPTHEATPATLPPSLAPPACATGRSGLPGYEILSELGRGGMGVVYKARQVKLNRVVALKMILGGEHAGGEGYERFRREAEAIAKLQHPNVVQIHEIGEDNGVPFFSLEFCPGGTLSGQMNGAAWEPRRATELMATLARAVHAAHERQVVHRDLKPGNVLLGADGTPKVTDFGLAKRLDEQGPTQAGQIMGTPSYMSPEQASGALDVGPASDVYALCAILYELLTGQPPFVGKTVYETLEQVCGADPAPPRRLQPRTPRDLETVCLKGLSKDPSRRYASAAALADDLGRFLAGEPIAARPVGRGERMWRWCRRHPWKAGAVASLVALLVVGCVAGVWVARERGLRRQQLEAAAQEQKERHAHVDEALDDALARVSERKWAEADQFVRRARSLCDAGAVDGDHSERVEELERAVRAVLKLEDARVQRCGMPNCIFNYDQAPPDGPFRALGIDVLRLPPEEAARRIRQSVVADELVAALDDWCWVLHQWDVERKGQIRRLRDVARLADPDPGRNRLREALTGGDAELERVALSLLPTALDNRPSPTYLILLANSLARVGRSDEAVGLLEKADLRFAANFWINLRLAELHKDAQRWDRALAYYRVTRALHPNNSVVLWSLAAVCTHVGDDAAAEFYFRQTAELRPQDPYAMHAQAGYYYERDPKKAIALYEGALKLDPEYLPSMLNLGALLCAHGDRERGVKLLEHGLDLARRPLRERPDDPAHKANLSLALQMLGAQRRNAKRFDEALALYREAVEASEGPARDHPRDARFRSAYVGSQIGLGRVQMLAGKTAEAKATFSRLLAQAEARAKAGDKESAELAEFVRQQLAMPGKK